MAHPLSYHWKSLVLNIYRTDNRNRNDSRENPESHVMQSESLLWFPLIHVVICEVCVISVSSGPCRTSPRRLSGIDSSTLSTASSTQKWEHYKVT